MKRSKPLSTLILIGLALFLSAAKPSPRPTESESRQPYIAQSPATTYNAGTISPTPVVPASPTPNLDKETGDDHAHSEYEAAQYRLNRIQTWFNGFLVLITLALVGVGAWQAHHLRQTVQATKETADAAMLSAKTTREAQRGYIFAGPMSTGAPLDNNICEQALKRAVLHRKNALFYRALNGAEVGDLFMSLIHTCQLNGANSFQYLTELQRHAPQVAVNPSEWMPWNYRETLERPGGI
jgi:Transposase IS66 family